VAGDGDSTNRKSSGRRDSKRRSSGIRESIARQRASAAEANQPSNKLALSRFRVLALASAKEMNFDVRSEDREDSDEDAMDKVGWGGDFKSKDARTFRRECLHTAVRARAHEGNCRQCCALTVFHLVLVGMCCCGCGRLLWTATQTCPRKTGEVLKVQQAHRAPLLFCAFVLTLLCILLHPMPPVPSPPSHAFTAIAVAAMTASLKFAQPTRKVRVVPRVLLKSGDLSTHSLACVSCCSAAHQVPELSGRDPQTTYPRRPDKEGECKQDQ
jgi:hypothetical protein